MSDKRDPTPINATWRGEKLYRCRLCAFDSTDKRRFEEHFARMHPPLEVIEGGKADTPKPRSKPQPTEVNDA